MALYYLTKTLDPTRPVIGNDGWESVATDVIGIHDYDASPERILERYREHALLPALFKRERPGGRALMLGAAAHADHPIVLSEFGGIALERAASVTQLTDTYQEANGLLFMDRTPKVPLESIAAATRGDGEPTQAAAGARNERHEAPE